MAEIGISIASKVAELSVKPIVSEFRYMCCFNNNVKGLEEVEDKLQREKKRVEGDVNAAKIKAEGIRKDVEDWLEDADKAFNDVRNINRQIEADKRCFCKWCPNWIWRYQLSKRLEREASKLVQLKEAGGFHKVSYQNPPQALDFLPNKDFMPFSSTKLAFEQIIKALEDDNVSMVGLYGVTGVGKTTLAREVGKQVKDLKLFDSVLSVAVSRTPDPISIQGEIAEKLGLPLQESSNDGRAGRLWQRVKSEKKLLVILDDVWSKLDLKDIGIPIREDHMGCKILLVVHNQSVCTSMGCQRMIGLNELSEHEAWELFRVNASLNDKSPSKDIAMEAAKWCKGLPQTIVTVGKALEGKPPNVWDAALERLKRSGQPKFGDAERSKIAYAHLKLRFSQLNNWETKLTFSLGIAIKSVYNGKYMRYVDEESEVHGFLKFSADDDSGPMTKFEVEPAWSENGLVHLKCCYNNKYFMRWSNHHWWMVAQADLPEEDVSKWSCTLFQPKFNDELCTVQFIHVQLGHYACLWRLQEPYGDCLFAGSQHSDQDKCGVYQVLRLYSGEEECLG